ncbi:phenylacetaldoxime dehydratase family protein [Gloeocapsopsis crepidinum LEGE 06123]|uniref:Phenylacetaldoxime dehydratase family protein n=1 Tax=Gloeocapsopsis crepidinum LEGE 06123 TaxID=588587 RepID=A0ABR9US53_9CHRO|nr:phenylacetaldoxime dehydratase family protein [Gloeocapsopsis crepidinum]MBE9190465.1 phenylacetaldoxime dehydratase family protein [Gloeocapsopsis crepidinum LEGE 06123]
MLQPTNEAYIAALWEHPQLCLAFFGVQFQTQAGQRLYEESGIREEMFSALKAATSEGLLLNRMLTSPEGPLLMQYWQSYSSLETWARKMPHTRWWNWLVENTGKGVAFYHEIYQVKTGEAIYEPGSSAVGPALFCSTQVVKSGEGRSRERQQRFVKDLQNKAI